MSDIKLIECSFCHKDSHSVKKIIAAPDGIFICDECVILCVQIMCGTAKNQVELEKVNSDVAQQAESRGE